MAKKESKQIDYSDFEKYQFGALAAHMLASKENSRYAPSALEVLAGEKGLNLGEEALGFIRGTQASEKGIQTASNVYGGKFEEKRGKYSPADLAGWYAPLLNGLELKEKEKITGILGDNNETLENITKKQKKASHIVEGEDIEGLYSKEQVADAKKILEKYQKLSVVLSILDNYKFESLRPDVIDEARKKDLKELASRL